MKRLPTPPREFVLKFWGYYMFPLSPFIFCISIAIILGSLLFFTSFIISVFNVSYIVLHFLISGFIITYFCRKEDPLLLKIGFILSGSSVVFVFFCLLRPNLLTTLIVLISCIILILISQKTEKLGSKALNQIHLFQSRNQWSNIENTGLSHATVEDLMILLLTGLMKLIPLYEEVELWFRYGFFALIEYAQPLLEKMRDVTNPNQRKEEDNE
ncbi:MAG TPA: hypothetical protein VLG12_03255 [Candidatus Saccharimonadales bacterium]|nr:hypothetical protein [Candidatus Saccharimonadales bacterium]